MENQLERLFGKMDANETAQAFAYIWDTYLTDEQKVEFLNAHNLIDKNEL